MMSRVTTMGMMMIIITQMTKIQECMKKYPKITGVDEEMIGVDDQPPKNDELIKATME